MAVVPLRRPSGGEFADRADRAILRLGLVHNRFGDAHVLRGIDLTVADGEVPRKVARLPRTEAESKARELLALVGLRAKADR